MAMVTPIEKAKARKKARQLLKYQLDNNLTFEDMMDIFALVAQMEGKKVLVDGLEWEVPPLGDEVL